MATSVSNAFEAGRAGIGAPSYQDLLARVDVYSESIVMTRYARDGQAATAYELAPGALAVAFSGQPMTTGLLPQGCLWVTRAAGLESVGLYLPPQRRTLRFEGGALYNVPLPGFVFAGIGDRWLIWAVKAYPGAESERLFHAPLPNVYADGHICLGNVAFPARSVQTIRHAARLFFESQFNSDLAAAKVDSPQPLRDWLAGLAGDEEFPLKALLPTPQVIGEVIAGVVRVC